jgi:ABC-2 type transport system permease protein/oleandomycin transport system permease protein
MSATTVTSPRGVVTPPRRSFATALADGWAITGRNVIVYRRVPTLVVFTLIQPVVFVLLFRYVFGGAIRVPGGIPYVDYLMPGIFVQTVAFGATNTAIGLATDVKSGLLERFHSLPMARSAVLTGRTFADLGRNVLVVAIMAIVGFAVGFRVQTNVAGFIAGVALVLLFAYAFSWVFATVGLAIGDPESAQAATFPVLAPVVFASSVFVPVSTMPGWLQGWAKYQPVSATANAARALMLGGPTLSWVLQSIGWCAAIVAICAPLAVWRYRRTN